MSDTASPPPTSRLSRLGLALALLLGLLVTVGPTAAAQPPPSFDTGPAARALARTVPGHHDQVELQALPRTGGDHYRVTGRAGRIVVAGTSPAVLLTGFNAYLKEVAKADISWNGEQLNLPRTLPAPPRPIVRNAQVTHRFALNDTDDGYTGPYRTWSDWEREIDVLALHGINEVLVTVGQEAVYRKAFQDFGYSDAELRGWIPGPAHQPWWLLQNLCCFPGTLSAKLVDDRAALGRRIADRLREVGITPVFPGYFGTVPDGFVERNAGARVVAQGNWGAFERPDWLDPRNPFFGRVAESFYRHQQDLFGPSTMFKMDLLHEGGTAGDVPVPDAARGVEAALQTAHPGATWVMLGWQSNPSREILGAVDRDKVFVVDGLSDRYQGLDREQSWLGTPYAFGSIWNFGGHTTMGANLPTWVETFPRWRDKAGSALDGIAVMPEAADNNPVALDLLTELAWLPGQVDLDAWLAGYATARYGGTDPHALAAWKALGATAYGMRADGWSEAQDGLFGARPSLTVATAASWSPSTMRYDAQRFDDALVELLRVDPALRGSTAYRYDLMDVARQVLSNRSRTLLPEIKAAYDAKDLGRFRTLTRQWLDLTKLLDRVVSTNEQTLLGPWIEAARSWASTPSEQALLEYDARSILTAWGTKAAANDGLHDYANREWGGLVGDFYHGRWKTYFDELDKALAQGREPRAIDWATIEDGWAHERSSYPTTPRGEIHPVATEVVRTLAALPQQTRFDVTVAPRLVEPGGTVRATATFTNTNIAEPVTGVELALSAPAGFVVRATSPTTTARLDPDRTLTATWDVAVPAGGDARLVESTLRATATYAARAGAETRTDTTTVYAGDLPPQDPADRARYDFTLGYPVDVSRNGNDGTAGGKVAFDAAGAHFDGTDDSEVTVPYATSYQPESITTWQRWRLELTGIVPASTGPDHQAVASGRGAADGWIVYIAPGGTLEFWMGQSEGGAYAVASSGVQVVPGQRYDVVAEWDGSGLSIQVTGAAQGTGSSTVSGTYRPVAHQAPLRFGNGGDAGTQYRYTGALATAAVRVVG